MSPRRSTDRLPVDWSGLASTHSGLSCTENAFAPLNQAALAWGGCFPVPPFAPAPLRDAFPGPFSLVGS